MMRASPWQWMRGLLLAALVWSTTGQAAEALLWDFPRDYPRQPASFRITYRSSNDPGGVLQQLGVPWHPLDACASLAPDGTLTPDMFCATVPTCLAPGLYTFWAQAIWPDAESDRSELFTCQATLPCQCQPVASGETLQARPSPAALVTIAGGALPPIPTQPALPPMTPVDVPQPVFHLPARVEA